MFGRIRQRLSSGSGGLRVKPWFRLNARHVDFPLHNARPAQADRPGLKFHPPNLNLRSYYRRRSLPPQRHHGIDLGRAPGGNVAGEQRRDGECHGDDNECQRIGRFHAIEQACKKARERQRDGDSDRNANGGQCESLSNDKP